MDRLLDPNGGGFDGSGLRRGGLVHRGYTNTRIFKLAFGFLGKPGTVMARKTNDGST